MLNSSNWSRRSGLAVALIGCGLSLLLAVNAASAAEPAASAPHRAGGHASAPALKKGVPAKPVKLVDINSANKAELTRLPGIGDTEADKIVAGRPYLTKADLVTKNVLPTGMYLSIKRGIVAMPKSPKLTESKPKP